MSDDTKIISGEEKKEFERVPFWLSPPVEYSMISTLDDYIDVILSQIGEEGEKRTFSGYFTGFWDYKNSQKNVQLKRIFTGFFESFEELKEKLKEGGLEKTASLIEMEVPDENGFGLILYQRAHRVKGDFATYRQIQREALLKILKSDWNMERK